MGNQNVTPWSDDKIAELTKLYAEGYSATIIGEKLGLSRNSIIGKVHRLGLLMPANRITKQRKAKPKPEKPVNRSIVRIVRANGNSDTMRAMTTIETAQYNLRCVEIEPRNLSLIELEPGDCRYPYGDETITFCGHPKMEGKSYCAPHFHLCWEPSRPKVDRRFPRAAA